jgi:hypothetical protein
MFEMDGAEYCKCQIYGSVKKCKTHNNHNILEYDISNIVPTYTNISLYYLKNSRYHIEDAQVIDTYTNLPYYVRYLCISTDVSSLCITWNSAIAKNTQYYKFTIDSNWGFTHFMNNCNYEMLCFTNSNYPYLSPKCTQYDTYLDHCIVMYDWTDYFPSSLIHLSHISLPIETMSDNLPIMMEIICSGCGEDACKWKYNAKCKRNLPANYKECNTMAIEFN